MGLGGHAKSFQHLHTGPRHAALQHRRNGRRAMANGARRFAVGANHKAGLIDETDDGQVKTITKIDKTAHFLCRCGGHGAGIIEAIIADDADALAIEPRQSGD